MKYLHTMVRVTDLDASLDFYCAKLGLEELRRIDNEAGRFTLVFLAAPGDSEAQVELTHNWAPAGPPQEPSAGEREGATPRKQEPSAGEREGATPRKQELLSGGRNFGHLAYRVDDIYALCQRLMDGGVTINRPPRDGRMAFVRSPDNISIELLQNGAPMPPREPWASMPNTGEW